MSQTKQLSVIKLFYPVVLVMLAGCIVYPDPWRTELYVGENPQWNHLYDLPYTHQEVLPYVVGGDYLAIQIIAENATTTSGNSPYRALISLWNGGASESVSIFHSVNILLGETDLSGYSLSTADDVEINLPFQAKTQSTGLIRTSIYANPLEVNHESGQDITVIVDVEVIESGVSERKTILARFKPTVKKGFWSFPEV